MQHHVRNSFRDCLPSVISVGVVPLQFWTCRPLHDHKNERMKATVAWSEWICLCQARHLLCIKMLHVLCVVAMSVYLQLGHPPT